ncbi:MAG: hypothetical protein F7C81_00170 [Desulfurococcales archaeon]|nr:hypothetical protein [Desulfurococcales archaeon]
MKKAILAYREPLEKPGLLLIDAIVTLTRKHCNVDAILAFHGDSKIVT